ncbi:alpha/beta-hydrolase [Xylariomycetidae sp. FL2044]|nr:alpha/beta-hydrolase [Xylariomycetidae sp. FL2044]
MLNFYLSYKYLAWRRPSGLPTPPPEGIDRTYVETPGGDIELLCARPSVPTLNTPPVVFAHGGMGCALLWVPYMRYLAARGVTSYAVSVRGHGASWHPSFLRMLYTVTKRQLGDDLVAGIRAVQQREGSKVVLVGHSSGGGLSQFILSEGDVKVRALALLGAVPGTGSWRVYLNWARFDPWFAIRMLFHGWHSNSPLSHPFLVRRAFFSSDYPEDKVLRFQSFLCSYESFLWPLGMMFPFVDAKRLLQNIVAWGNSPRILIMSGTDDMLMTRNVQVKAAETYRNVFQGMIAEKNLEADEDAVTYLDEEGGMDSVSRGVHLAWVPGAGHHLQNDTTWEIGAQKLFAFLQLL